MKSYISRQLDKLERTLEPLKPEKLTVTLSDGSTAIEDAASVWRFFKDPALRKQVVSISADQPGYAELAGVIEMLCRS